MKAYKALLIFRIPVVADSLLKLFLWQPLQVDQSAS